MFTNPDYNAEGTIKSFAKLIYVLSIVIAVIAVIAGFVLSEEDELWLIMSAAGCFVVPLCGIITANLIYGFGDIVGKVRRISDTPKSSNTIFQSNTKGTSSVATTSTSNQSSSTVRLPEL